ncbi:MAG: potassium-transporting ATPase subunit KdpA [Elusimicrobia bacterium]|nr:potassium-transporting ATPase subunit KdpA [Elusimicrobiota bacterium]
MTGLSFLQFVLIFGTLLLTTKPLGAYMKKVFGGERTVLTPVVGALESWIYRLSGIDPGEEMNWRRYCASVLAFSAAGAVILYVQLRFQQYLGLDRAGASGIDPALAFNTAVSFMTNTNWQAYSGETAMTYVSQMTGLAYHNFVSAAAGIAVAVAVMRGFTRASSSTLGNFWADLVRGCLFLLLPLSIAGGLFLVSQGVIQNFKPYVKARTLVGAEQTLPMGPVASQEIIKQVGTNGGGFFGANSAHPFENPTPLTNYVAMLAIFLIPAALTYQFGLMAGDTRQGWAIFACMSVLFFAGFLAANYYEQKGNPILAAHGADQAQSANSSGGNMEGKEVRFGIASSALFATMTTDASCGAVNAQHDSFTPLGGLVPLFNLMLGEVIFGGVGSGFYGMILLVVVTVFIAGLMVGRTPEYLGKKIEARDMKYATLGILIPSFVILGLAAWAAVRPSALMNLGNAGPHGLSEILYAYSSAVGNNGSAFGGLSADNWFFNNTTGWAMLLGRFFIIVPVLALAGSLAGKKRAPESLGTFPTHTPLFVALLASVTIIVAGLTHFPALSLGPIIEHLLMLSGKLY